MSNKILKQSGLKLLNKKNLTDEIEVRLPIPELGLREHRFWPLRKKNLTGFTPLDRKNLTGFTLIEMLISMSIFILVIFLSSNFIIYGLRWTTFGSEQADAISTARRSMEVMVKDIRGANNSEQGDYPLSRIEKDDFIYYSDMDDDGKMEKIRYYLDGSELKKVVTEPGPANDYSLPGATSTIAYYVNNQEEPVFVYFDSNSAQTTDIDSVRMIRIVLKINVTPERAPNDYYAETDVHLRNLKSNL